MPERRDKPTQYASGYSLDLYCDHANEEAHLWDEFPHTFFGETFGGCVRDARSKGWVIRRQTRTATCPRCSGKKPRHDLASQVKTLGADSLLPDWKR